MCGGTILLKYMLPQLIGPLAVTAGTVILAGRVVEEGPSDRLVSAPCHPYTRRLISSVLELQ